MAKKVKKAPRRLRRQLMNGAWVTDEEQLQHLAIHTKCPKKWLFVDMESGAVWWKTLSENNWRNIGYVDVASMTSLVILPSASAGIPRFDFREERR